MTEQLVIGLMVTAGALVLAIGALRDRGLNWRSGFAMVAVWAVIIAVVTVFIGIYLA